jgi:hypothetical protein
MSSSHDPVRYMGFAVVTSGREYQFRVAGERSDDEARIFTVRISTADFRPGRLKFQEGPDIAIRKLRDVLACQASDTPPPELYHELTASEVSDYTAKGPAKAKALTEEQKLAAKQGYRNRLR